MDQRPRTATPRQRLLQAAAAAALALAAFGGAALLREAGALQRVDLAVHDRLTRLAFAAGGEPRIVVVLEHERDLRRWGFPLSDERLALLLERLLAAEPLAIAVDKYRDRSVPPGAERLDALLARSDRVYWVEKFGTVETGVPAPAALPSRFAACGDLVDDPDGNARRSLLYLDDGSRVCYSLAFRMAEAAVRGAGGAVRFAEDGSARVAFGRGELHAVDPGQGPYAKVDTGGFQVAVPSAAGLPAFRTVGLSDVLDGRVPAADLRGKLVFFGSAADSLRDFFNIPAPGQGEGYRKITGVEAHALFAAHFARVAAGDAVAMRLAPGAATHALAALMAVAGVLAGFRHRRLRVALALGSVGAVAYAAGVAALALRGVFLAPVAPALAFVLACAGAVVHIGRLERKEKAQLMQIFSRNVSPEIAEALWLRRDEIIDQGVVIPRAILASVFFVDIRGFTTVTERMAPERTVPWLNRGLAVMTETLMEHHGVVARFVGDQILGLFGAPVPRGSEEEIAEDARDAVRCALAIGPALERLNAEFAAEGLPAIRVRIGINSGPMTQCSVGTRSRMEFTVLGDSVNTAARLESYAMDDDGATVRVLVGQRTRELLGDAFRTREVGTLLLKGKDIPVTVHQVLSSS